jgi:phosphomannomutase
VITAKIEEIASRMMREHVVLEPAKPDSVEKIDISELYIRYINERNTLDIERIKSFIRSEDCIICVDNVHGATRGRIQRILGESAKIKYLRTEDDFLFGGAAPEPSEENMQGVERV